MSSTSAPGVYILCGVLPGHGGSLTHPLKHKQAPDLTPAGWWVQVGVPIVMTKGDLKWVAPLWMEYTQRVRLDPLVRELSP